MRIRKHVRRVSVGFPEGESQMFGVWRFGWDRDCEKLLQRAAAAAAAADAVQEELSWVDFLTMSKHGGISSLVDNDHGQEAAEAAEAAVCFSNECAKPESVSENSSRIGDLNLLNVERVNIMQPQQGVDEHVTRHYVRRRRGGDGAAAAASVQRGCANANLNAARQITIGTSNRDSKMYALKQSCFKFGEEIQLQGSLRADLSIAGDTTCTIPKGESFHNKEIIRDHPSREPEGSLLHALYLQLLAAGKEGLTLKELFASFKTQTSLPNLAVDWKDRVRAQLKTNPYFGEVKGRYLLREKIVQLNATMSGFRAARCKSSVAREDVQPFESAGIPTALHFSCDSKDIHEVIQTSRKTDKNFIEAALSESATETRKILQDAGTKVLSTVMDFRAFNSVATPPIDRRETTQSTTQVIPSLEPSRRKKKPSLRNDDDIFQSLMNGRATPGALIALQAKIVAESGVRTGARCSRKDDHRNWQCPLMAKEGHTLCKHHIFLKEKKKAQHAEDARISKSEKLSKKLQEVPSLIALGHELKSPESKHEDLVVGHVVEALVTLKSHVPTDAASQYLTQAIVGYKLAGEEIVKDDELKRTSEKLLQHLFTSAPKRRHVAAKKTVVNGPLLKENGQPPQLPAIPQALPMHYGVRRKTVKNKSLLSF